jgi:hypothetical protein
VTFQGVKLDLSGESGPVRAHIRGMPVMVRTAADGYRYASPDFGAEFLGAVIAGVPEADRTGVPWNRVTRCAGCTLPLSAPTSEADFKVSIQLRGLPQFEVEIRSPSVTCDHCGTVQMPPSRDLDFHRTEALLQAFKAAGVEPA